MPKPSKYLLSLIGALLFFSAPVFAGEPKGPSVFSNPLAVVMIVLMIILLIIIGVLANVLVGAAQLKMKNRQEEKRSAASKVFLFALLLSPGSSLFAQADGANVAKTGSATIGDMAASTFYLMVVILFLELVVVLALLLNIKLLLGKEKEKARVHSAELQEAEKQARLNRLSWWDRFNKLRPVHQEAELDLGHEYDGIRELNNRLPPWWLYGFYLTIIFAGVYLWRFHVSHSGPSSREEYEHAVVTGEMKVREYLKKKGESVDENTVVLLTAADDIDAGKAIFLDPSKCVACHGPEGGGTIGPNLADDYWLYGGSVKDIFKVIKYGTNKGMRSWKDDLSAKQIAQVSSYIRSIRGSKPANAKEPQGELYKEQVQADTTKVLLVNTASVKN